MLSLLRTTDRNDHSAKPLAFHNSQHVNESRFEPEANKRALCRQISIRPSRELGKFVKISCHRHIGCCKNAILLNSQIVQLVGQATFSLTRGSLYKPNHQTENHVPLPHTKAGSMITVLMRSQCILCCCSVYVDSDGRKKYYLLDYLEQF